MAWTLLLFSMQSMASADDPLLAELPRGASDARAIERVLDAEREAERAVEAATRDAERLAAEARERARRIGERTDARIKQLNARSNALADAAIERLRSEYADRARESARTLTDDALLASAVAAVAAWLLGDEGEK